MPDPKCLSGRRSLSKQLTLPSSDNYSELCRDGTVPLQTPTVFSLGLFHQKSWDGTEYAKVLSRDACTSLMCDRDVHMQVKHQAPLQS